MTERIKEILMQYNLSPSAFADKINVQRSSISHILSERNKPSLDLIQKILDTFPEIDLNWLIKGEGNLNTGQDTTRKTPTQAPTFLTKKEPTTDFSMQTVVNQAKKEAAEQPNKNNHNAAPNEPKNQSFYNRKRRTNNLEADMVKSVKKNNTADKKLTRIVAFYSDQTWAELPI